ncbi:MAG: multidrug effflux MFS transporter [Gammaproteobacteria bacterium]|nr:multidrug effflux MFS transporter [Gammaproteobacteria bacterium]
MITNKAQLDKPDTSKNVVVAILVMATALSIMSTDMYAPSLPDLTGYFDTNATMVKLTISLNLLAFGIAQLIHGPLSDRFGRRPVLLVSLFFVAVLCLACAFAQSIEQLIVARVLLGLAAAAEAVVGFAIIKDRFNEKEQVKVLALFGMVLAIAPAIAPIVGGYLHVHLGWQSNFFVLTGMAVLVWFVIFFHLSESATIDQAALQPARLISGYALHIGNLEFMVHSAMCGVAMGLIFVFVTGAPFVYIDMLDVAVQHYGYYQALVVLAFFCGSLLASSVSDRMDHGRLLIGGNLIILMGAAMQVSFIALDLLTPIRLTVAQAIMLFGMGPLFAVAPSRAMRSVHQQTGSASALLSGIENSAAAVAAIMISVMHDGTAYPMAWVSLFLSASLLLLLYHSRRATHISNLRVDG